jgi:hypothetical protein
MLLNLQLNKSWQPLRSRRSVVLVDRLTKARLLMGIHKAMGAYRPNTNPASQTVICFILDPQHQYHIPHSTLHMPTAIPFSISLPPLREVNHRRHNQRMGTLLNLAPRPLSPMLRQPTSTRLAQTTILNLQASTASIHHTTMGHPISTRDTSQFHRHSNQRLDQCHLSPT